MAVDEALVDALVAAAEQDRAPARGELADQGLVERPAGGREVDQRRRRASPRSARTAASARSSGSTSITMPGPPP